MWSGQDRDGLAGEQQAANGARMGANRRAGGGASPVVNQGMGRRAWKAGVHHRDTEDTENCIGKTAHASLNCFLTRRRKVAKNRKGLRGSWAGGSASSGVDRGLVVGLEGWVIRRSTQIYADSGDR